MSKPLRILYVEDQVDLRDLMADVFADMGMDVKLAADAQTAFEMLTSGTEVDVLFTDVYMPGQMTGAELSLRVQKMMPHIKIVLASGHSRHQLPPLPSEIEFVQKPYSLGQVIKMLQTFQSAAA
ncbi:Response regulator receiver domain-containing protein [Pseudoxanthomonas sp. GM95]|uniref:response regulator n=1 Tax=Pseudoxanthomonas sp. GM95 TaxID=1881043 RepID=UPI0008BF1188|nr:response regulator [Pseudoxanthomonas sp. GM95]SEL16404.1 Response regulator receiver domain-containing protein [Pseudoxanthomonas sp. GM95]